MQRIPTGFWLPDQGCRACEATLGYGSEHSQPQRGCGLIDSVPCHHVPEAAWPQPLCGWNPIQWQPRVVLVPRTNPGLEASTPLALKTPRHGLKGISYLRPCGWKFEGPNFRIHVSISAPLSALSGAPRETTTACIRHGAIAVAKPSGEEQMGFGKGRTWWARRDSNPRPTACKAAALTAAPLARAPSVSNELPTPTKNGDSIFGRIGSRGGTPHRSANPRRTTACEPSTGGQPAPLHSRFETEAGERFGSFAPG
jgi:hypothetical protein